MKQTKIVLVGIGGYGGLFVEEFLQRPCKELVLAGAVDPYPEKSRFYDELKEKNIPIFSSMEEFYRNNDADLAVIATPIFLHTEHMLTALKNGSNVLCEKPLCADEADIEILKREKEKSGKFVAIGYQWAYSEAITELKKDILNGKFGKLIEMKTLCLRPRKREYFERGVGWAGKIQTPDGKLVYDSVANNSAAHYLFNMLYVLGEEGRAAEPENISACLLRANNIENFDACKIDFELSGGAKCSFISAHPVTNTVGPLFEYRFQKGTVYYAYKPQDSEWNILPQKYSEYGEIVALMNDGTKKVYGDPMKNPCKKMHIAAQMAANGEKSDGVCGLLATAVHTKMINEIQKKFKISDISKSLLEEKDGLLYADGLLESAILCYTDTEKAFFVEE